MQTIDLSHDLKEGMPVYPGTGSPVISTVYSIYDSGFAELKLEFFTHTGTHIDAPAHILKKSKTISDLDIDQFLGKAFVLRYSATAKLSTGHIEGAIKKWGSPDFIILSCEWDKFWGTRQYFKGFPLPETSVFYLLSQLGLKGIGIDAISIDKPDTSIYPNHRLILSSNTIIIENMKGLNRLPDGLFELFCFPVNIFNADGSPVRAVARF